MIGISTYSGECDGLGYAAEMVGIEVVAYCEADPKRRAKLAERHPGKPIFTSDEELTADALRAIGIDPHGIDIIFGGPPCQPFSVAGAQRATDDPRHRWPQMLRVIQECRPRWVLVENVGGFVRLALDLVWSDLEAEDYEVGAIVLPALAVGAPHRRDRCFVVGYAYGNQLREYSMDGRQIAGEIDKAASASGMAHPRSGGSQERIPGQEHLQERNTTKSDYNCQGTGLADAECARQSQPSGQLEECGRRVSDSGSMANSHSARLEGWRCEGLRKCAGEWPTGKGDTSSVDNTNRGRCDRIHSGNEERTESESGYTLHDWRPAQPRMGRTLDGVSAKLDEINARLDDQMPHWPAWRGQEQHGWEPPRTVTGMKERPRRIESLGLAVVPWQVYPLFALIKETEKLSSI